jgi:hypothetical protein
LAAKDDYDAGETGECDSNLRCCAKGFTRFHEYRFSVKLDVMRRKTLPLFEIARVRVRAWNCLNNATKANRRASARPLEQPGYGFGYSSPTTPTIPGPLRHHSLQKQTGCVRRIPETDPDAILRKTPAELSKKSRLACNTPFVLVKHYYVRYRSDSDP